MPNPKPITLTQVAESAYQGTEAPQEFVVVGPVPGGGGGGGGPVAIADVTGLEDALADRATIDALADLASEATVALDSLSDVVATKASEENVAAALAGKASTGDLDNVFTIATEAGSDAAVALSAAGSAGAAASAAQSAAAEAIAANVVLGVLDHDQVPPSPGVYLRRPAVAFVGALDAFAAPYRAHSLRRLLSTYGGPLVKIRRSSDNATAEIGYTSSGDLDTSALLAFVGAGDGFVDTFYDQGANGRHLSQATAANQPRIASAGVVDTVAGKPALVFDGTTDLMISATAGLFSAAAATVAMVMKAASSTPTNATLFSETRTANNNGFWRALRGSTASWNVQATDDAGTALWGSSAAGSNLFDTLHHQATYIEGSGTINTWRDGVAAHVALAANRAGTTTPIQTVLGAHSGSTASNWYGGAVQELVAWTSARTADRVAIQDVQADYWGTP